MDSKHLQKILKKFKISCFNTSDKICNYENNGDFRKTNLPSNGNT